MEPTAPKRPPSAYMIYCMQNRDEIKENHPDMKLTEINKMLGNGWKSMTDEEKKYYHNQAENSKAVYELNLKAYQD
eukprot:gene10086-2508_t